MAIDLSTVQAGLFGLCVGDALGVPVEFTSRAERDRDPVTEMQGWGTYHQPPGTWSDDSSLTFCLADALAAGNWQQADLLRATSERFLRWQQAGDWTPHGQCFDIGVTTARAIGRLALGVEPSQAGETGERSNGNGSLMRILPIAFCHEVWPFADFLALIHDLSRLTHAHPRSLMACGFYVQIAMLLLQGADLVTAYREGFSALQPYYKKAPFAAELPHFQRLSAGNMEELPREAIRSTGYVIHTLEAAIWCLLTTPSYTEAVLKAVNLGEDTDTTGAVTGGLAGLYYGLDSIPAAWRAQMAGVERILDLSERLMQAIQRHAPPKN